MNKQLLEDDHGGCITRSKDGAPGYASPGPHLALPEMVRAQVHTQTMCRNARHGDLELAVSRTVCLVWPHAVGQSHH